MNFVQGDIVLVKARPKSYMATVEWVDRYFSGDPAKAKVRPLASELTGVLTDRARNVNAKFILEVIRRG